MDEFGDTVIAVTTVQMLLLVHQKSDIPGAGAIGLSQGARIGIGVGAAAGGLVLLVAIGLFIRRVRRRRLSQPRNNPEIEAYVPVQTGPVMHHEPKPAELDPYAVSEMGTIETHQRYSAATGQHLAVPFSAEGTSVRH